MTTGAAAAIAPEPFDGSGPVAPADDVTTLADIENDSTDHAATLR